MQSRMIRRIGLAMAVSLVSLVALGTSAMAHPPETLGTETPFTNENPECADLGDFFELKIDPVPSGMNDFSDGTLNVSINVVEDPDLGWMFSWNSNIGVDYVIAKGGPNSGGNIYSYDPEATADAGLHAAPAGAEGKYAQLSHITFCYTEGGGGDEQATLRVRKFYDANANGINDDGILITGWRVRIDPDSEAFRFTPVDLVVEPGDYNVSEDDPIETNWVSTTPKSVDVSLADGDDETVEFGNYCTTPSGGRTLGFWSNKNGEKTMGDDGGVDSELAMLTGLNLRDADGSHFNPTTYAQFRTWLLGGNATNMAYMLSVQLAAMALNVEAGFVDGGAFVAGFGGTIDELMVEANAYLDVFGNTPSGHAQRSAQETLKNYLDDLNNNGPVVSPVPCDFSFADEE